MPNNTSIQILAFNIALFLFNFALIQYLVTKILIYKNLQKEKVIEPEQKLLLEANKKAEEIIADASEKATQIITSSSQKLEKLNQSFEEQVNIAINVEKTKLKETFSNINTNNVNLNSEINNILRQNMTDLGKGLQESGKISLDNIFKDLQKDTLQTSKTINKKLDNEYQIAIVQLAKYKEEQKSQIDTKILEQIKYITKQVLPNAFTSKENDDLIFESINKVKQDKVFN